MTGTRRQRLAVGLAMQLILLALVVAIVALGNRTWSRGFVIFVDFDRLDNLKEGAEVRISGQVVGRVLAIWGAPADSLRRGGRPSRPSRNESGVIPGEPPRQARVRLRLWLERDRAELVRRSSIFYQSSKGVIGERTLEVGPSPGEPLAAVGPGEVFRGVDPPAIDRLIQKGYANLRATLAVMRELQPELRDLGSVIERVRGRLAAIASEAQLRRLRAGLEAVASEAGGLLAALRAGTEGGTLPRRILGELDAIAARGGPGIETAARKLAALEKQGEELRALLPPVERERLARSLERLRQAARQAEAIAVTAAKLARKVEAGRGTLGRFLTDSELNDELKDAHRVLKESPWRALARPPADRAPRGAPRRKDR